MALAVASTSNVSSSHANDLVITKPSGVASGDLLVIVASGRWDTNNLNTPDCTGFAVAGQAYGGETGVRPTCMSFLWKVADSSDVSASNYTIGLAGNTTLGAAAMFRITGWTGTTSPVFFVDANNVIDASATSVALGKSATSPRPSATTIMFIAMTMNNPSAASPSTASYSVTSGESNPTWTEVWDTTYQTNSDSSTTNNAFAVAYATTTNNTSVTAWAATTSKNSNAASIGSFLVMIGEPVSATSDISHNAIVPGVHSPTVTQVNTTLDVSHNAVVPTVNGIPTRATAPTQWQNEDKPSTAWINDSL